MERTYMVTEICPHCENEINMFWNTDEMGFKAFCPVCGERLMLCDECMHRTGELINDCDYCSKNDSCRFNPKEDRGKDDESEEFVYGYYQLERDMRRKAPFLLKPSISWKENDILFSSFIIPDTIGQYTGLTDKNGKRIFEGDILKYKSNPPCKVSYINCQFVMMWRYVYRDFSDVYDYDIEVIGNIYDNPELLKESEQK